MSGTSVSSLVEELLSEGLHHIGLQKVLLAEGISDPAACLIKLCQIYQNERRFSAHPLKDTFKKLLMFLKSYYITKEWLGGVALEACAAEMTHAVLMTLRLLLRDDKFQHIFMKPPSPLLPLTLAFSHFIKVNFTSNNSHAYTPDLIKELTNIFQKLSNTSHYRGDLVEVRVHHYLVQLLHSSELTSLQCSICALTNLCKSEHTCASVAKLNCAMPLLTIMTTFDPVSRQLAADLLLLLSQHSSICDQIRDVDGLPVCLKLLHSDDLHLLNRSVGLLDHLTKSSSDVQDEIRLLGGIPLLLTILSKHNLSSLPSSEVADKVLALQAVCCSTLAQLGLNDSNSQQIVQGNGVYLISMFVLPIATKGVAPDARLMESLQLHALRTLRYLFSMERHRRVFKRLFPPNLFATFIDIGHYTYELSAYSQLVHAINNLPESERAILQTNIEGTNQNRDALSTIGGYSVLELLGSGAFGSVYKVHKVQQKEQLLALKEIRCSHAGLGRTAIEQSTNLGRLLNEVEIMREQLRHPNVVRYHKCFQEASHLYIVMELVEGAPLIEHINSLQEKGQRFTEARLWSIFTQLVLALRYIHKEKHIVHRDLSPSNLMLGEGDHLTITDFGLAKQKQREFSVMQSVVGTMPYWCPELVENEPYTEKVDIWAAGCILYQMASLKPPFYSSNMLALAKKIVEVDYVKLPKGVYSSLVGGVVQHCLTSDPDQRPDSVELGALIAPVMMMEMDKMATAVETLQTKLDREKQRTIKHFHKAVWTEQKYRELLLSSSQESQRHPPTHPHLSARRKLSTSFTSVQFSSLPTPIAEGEVPGLSANQGDGRSRSHSRDTSPEGSVDSDGVMCEAGDPLQHSSTSDNVFMEPDNQAATSLTFQHQYPSNWNGIQTELSNLSSTANTSPQVSKLRPHSHRPNPLISHINGSRARSQSAIFVGKEDHPFSLVANGSPLSRRATLALIGRSHPGGSGHNFGSMSPLTSGHKSRTASASSTLSISPRHLREISDPITILLSQLHKLIYLIQLPPSHKPSARKTLIEQYKRYLFDGTSDPSNLKSELHKLSSGVSDIVQVLSEREGHRMVERCLDELRGLSLGGDRYQVHTHGAGGEGEITYEQLQAIIESLVVENGYYQTAT